MNKYVEYLLTAVVLGLLVAVIWLSIENSTKTLFEFAFENWYAFPASLFLSLASLFVRMLGESYYEAQHRKDLSGRWFSVWGFLTAVGLIIWFIAIVAKSAVWMCASFVPAGLLFLTAFMCIVAYDVLHTEKRKSG